MWILKRISLWPLIFSALLALGSTYQAVYAQAMVDKKTVHFSALEKKNVSVAGLMAKPQSVQKRRNKKSFGTTPVAQSKIQQQIYQALKVRKKKTLPRKGKKQHPAATVAQKEQLQRLVSTYSSSTTPVKVAFDQRTGVPTLIKGKFKPKIAKRYQGEARHQALAKTFMQENSALLRLDSPAQELKLQQSKRDKLGKVHLRYQQQYKGIPLWGKNALVHLNKNDEIYLFQTHHEPTPQGLSTTPGITSTAALDAVNQHLNISAKLIEPAAVELVIYTPINGVTQLVFKVEIMPALDQRWIYFIDANTAEVVHRINNIHHAGSVVTASGQDAFGITRNFSAWSEYGRFYQINPMIPVNDPPFDPLGSGAKPTGDTFIYDIKNSTQGNLYYTESSQQNSGWDAVGVSAAYNTQLVYDYFLNTFNRKSLDDNNLNLFSVIHFGSNYPNAFWNGTYMVYGDGDNITFSSLAGCLDVAAHEMAHGVTEHTAALIYENQSGALNESWSDFFGAMVDRSDWLIGEDCVVRAPGFLRSMANPAQGLSAQPIKMSQYQNLPNTEAGDWGGVHINSGIPNRAAYLVAEGLTVEGLGASIGRLKTEQIWYRALNIYLQASSKFTDARRATIQSAEDLYGVASVEASAVTAAWDVVEVNDVAAGSPGDSRPTPTNPVVGTDGVLYLYPRDGTHDKPFDWSEKYDLYWQVIPSPFPGYDNNLNYGPFNSGVTAAYTRPAAYTDVDGTVFFYVGDDDNLYAVNADGTAHQQLTTAGYIYSIAISPDGRYLAYTSTDVADNNIHVLDLVTEVVADYPILPPNYQGSGSDVLNTILFPDALAFDYTGKQIVFDALNCISSPGSLCQNGDGYQYWSIGILNLADNSFFFPFPSQNPNIDLGYPSFASNNNFVIVMDKIDLSNYTTNGTIISRVVTVNLETQMVTEIANPNMTANTWNAWGVPSFFGNDDYITLQRLKQDISGTTYRIPIDANWVASGTLEGLNNYDAAMPLMHRAGVRQLIATLQLNKNSLSFGAHNVDSTSEQIIILTNTGNRDISILEINLANAAFSHDGINGRLPQGQEMSIRVQFKPKAAGSYNGALIIKSDADAPELSVALSGIAIPIIDTDGDGLPDESDPDDDNDGMPDIWEKANGLNPLESSDAAIDIDSDGLSNLQEYQAGTKPRVDDTDRDGMSDGFEINEGFNPLDNSDCPTWYCGSGRGGWRATISKAMLIDTDGDGLLDKSDSDDDNDGMPDIWEKANGLNPLKSSDAAVDIDSDGLSNLQEYQAGTKPRVNDTDRDGMPDGLEVSEGFNPLDSSDCPAWYCGSGIGGWWTTI